MGKKSPPAQPPAPDPYATAQAQSLENKQAAIAQANLNRINQYTPQGSSVYTQIGTNADGTPQYQQTTTLNPVEQQKYDVSNQVALSLDRLANSNIGRVTQVQSTPFNYSGMMPQVSNIRPGALQTGPTSALPVQTGVGNVGTAQIADPSQAGNIQGSLNYSGLSALPGVGDFSADASNVANSVYNQAASRLDPQYAQLDSQTRSRLAAQGISENSPAYQRAMDNLARQR